MTWQIVVLPQLKCFRLYSIGAILHEQNVELKLISIITVTQETERTDDYFNTQNEILPCFSDKQNGFFKFQTPTDECEKSHHTGCPYYTHLILQIENKHYYGKVEIIKKS